MTHFFASFTVAAFVGWLAVPEAAAQPQPTTEQPDATGPSAEHRKLAAELFQAGQAAYAQKQYPVAAEAFEQAYALAPHHAALWNAARAREMAGQKRMAANHYHRFLDIAPVHAKGHAEATQATEWLTKELGRLDISAAGASEVTVNDEPVDGAVYYVDAGEQHVVAQFAHGTRDVRVVASAGVRTPVTLTAPLPPAPAVAPPPPPLTPAPPNEIPVASGDPEASQSAERSSGGWSPWVVVVGTTVSLAAAGVSIWFAVDGKDANDAFKDDPSEENRKARDAANFRTFSTLGVGTGVGVLTMLTAAWLVDWGSDDEATSFTFTPGGVSVRGRF